MPFAFGQTSFVTVNGLRLAYNEVSPQQPRGTILLLTGLAAKRYGWYKQLDEFGRFYRTIALDHCDISDSDEVTEFYAITDLADDAAGALHALGVERANVIGISMGGFVTLHLALRHPELVEKLVLVSTSAGGKTSEQASAETLALLNNRGSGAEPGEIARNIYTQIMGPGYAASHPREMETIVQNARYRPQTTASYFRQLQAIAGHDASQQLSRIYAPTLIIHGEADPLVPFANGQYLARHIPGARLIAYPGVGHTPIIENAEQFNRDVMEFLIREPHT